MGWFQWYLSVSLKPAQNWMNKFKKNWLGMKWVKISWKLLIILLIEIQWSKYIVRLVCLTETTKISVGQQRSILFVVQWTTNLSFQILIISVSDKLKLFEDNLIFQLQDKLIYFLILNTVDILIFMFVCCVSEHSSLYASCDQSCRQGSGEMVWWCTPSALHNSKKAFLVFLAPPQPKH